MTAVPSPMMIETSNSKHWAAPGDVAAHLQCGRRPCRSCPDILNVYNRVLAYRRRPWRRIATVMQIRALRRGLTLFSRTVASSRLGPETNCRLDLITSAILRHIQVLRCFPVRWGTVSHLHWDGAAAKMDGKLSCLHVARRR
jgi:hypothetical protein